MEQTGWLDNRILRTGASVLLAFFLLYRLAGFYIIAFQGFAWDFSINWTAALGLREGLSVYDRSALQQLAIQQIDGGMQALFSGRFTSFIGLPTTALAHLPFTWLRFDDSVQCYRVLSLLGMLAAIALTGLSLPVPQQRRAWLAGLLCLLTWHAFPLSLQLGQVDAWVMLALATGVYATARQRPVLAGFAMGMAVLLKISPGWLLLYCLLQRRWRVLWAGVACVAGGLLLSLYPQHGRDLLAFFTVILPSLGDSPLHIQNQSLGAFLARLATDDVQLLSFTAGTGYWKLVALLVAGLLLVRLHSRSTHAPQAASDLATVILLALLAGPLTWDHYLSWAVIPVMLLAASLRGPGLLLLAGLCLPLVFRVPYLQADLLVEHGSWRWLTGLQVLAMLGLAIWMTGRRSTVAGD